jgi:4a-hydroxytetrahydrobiopterin dehydratase
MADRVLLSDSDLESNLEKLPEWRVDGKFLKRRFEFSNFAESLVFINKVGSIAEEADHHPDIYFGWGYAEINLTTHDRGGITDLDFEVAVKISGI